jgi:hypothetical protein
MINFSILNCGLLQKSVVLDIVDCVLTIIGPLVEEFSWIHDITNPTIGAPVVLLTTAQFVARTTILVYG